MGVTRYCNILLLQVTSKITRYFCKTRPGRGVHRGCYQKLSETSTPLASNRTRLFVLRNYFVWGHLRACSVPVEGGCHTVHLQSRPCDWPCCRCIPFYRPRSHSHVQQCISHFPTTLYSFIEHTNYNENNTEFFLQITSYNTRINEVTSFKTRWPCSKHL